VSDFSESTRSEAWFTSIVQDAVREVQASNPKYVADALKCRIASGLPVTAKVDVGILNGLVSVLVLLDTTYYQYVLFW